MDKIYWIWLQCALGCGNPAADFIVKSKISPETLYDYSEAQLKSLDCLTAGLIKKLKSTPLDKAEVILRQCEALKIWLMVPSDDDYPERLKNIYQVPIVLYGIGNRELLSKDLLITMVGSRKTTLVGEQSAYQLAQDLGSCGFGIVSGMALGIDSFCHKGVLDIGGDTIGVSACGLNIDYPNGNRDIRKRIARKGAMITEYPPGITPAPHHFPVRNRILSGLSLGTIVVEASEKSGALITANLALDQGKDVFALPTDLYNSNAQGNLKLIGQGACVVTSAQTIIDEYCGLYGDKIIDNISKKNLLQSSENSTSETLIDKYQKIITQNLEKKEEIQISQTTTQISKEFLIPEDLEPQHKAVLECLGEKQLYAEEIALQCGITMQEVLVILSELEIEGLLQAYPGKKFGR